MRKVRLLDWQIKVDVVIQKGTNRPIEKRALEEGVEL